MLLTLQPRNLTPTPTLTRTLTCGTFDYMQVESDHALVYMAAQMAAAMPDLVDIDCAFFGRTVIFGFDR